MKVKELIKDLSFFDDEDDILAYLYDKDFKVEYECDFIVEGDVVPMLGLKDIERYENGNAEIN